MSPTLCLPSCCLISKAPSFDVKKKKFYVLDNDTNCFDQGNPVSILAEKLIRMVSVSVTVSFQGVSSFPKKVDIQFPVTERERLTVKFVKFDSTTNTENGALKSSYTFDSLEFSLRSSTLTVGIPSHVESYRSLTGTPFPVEIISTEFQKKDEIVPLFGTIIPLDCPNLLDIEVENLFRAYTEIYNIEKNTSLIPDREARFIRRIVIPRLLVARDALVAIYKKTNSEEQCEIKISGKPSTRSHTHSSYLFFPGKGGELDRYASVKMVSPHLISICMLSCRILGGEKKCSLKIITNSENPAQFSVRAKLSAQGKIKCDEIRLNNISNEWDLVQSLDHPHISTCREIVLRTTSHGFNSKEVYLDVAIDFHEFISKTSKQLLSNFNSEKDCVHLINEMVKTMSHIVQAIDYIHKQGIFHLDIKLENILVEVTYIEGRLNLTGKITDFGSAAPKSEANKASSYYPTAGYFVKGANITWGLDAYSIGVVCERLVIHFTPMLSQKSVELGKPEILERRIGTFNELLNNITISLKNLKSGQYTPTLNFQEVIVLISEFFTNTQLI
jgi:hypothetical protein